MKHIARESVKVFKKLMDNKFFHLSSLIKATSNKVVIYSFHLDFFNDLKCAFNFLLCFNNIETKSQFCIQNIFYFHRYLFDNIL